MDLTREQIELENGKYRFYVENGVLKCDRYGKLWREFCGDKAVFALFDALRASAEGGPCGYAVRMSDGKWVGIWNDLATAELICAKQPAAHGDKVLPLYLYAHSAPSGMRLVPEEPTEHQYEAAKVMAETMIETVGKLDLVLIYKTFLQAAPEAK